MANLNSFVYYACGVINYDIKTSDNRDELLQHLVTFSESYNRISNYYFISHNETDVFHIHFIFVMSAQTRLETIYNKLCDTIVYKYKDTRDIYGIQIEKCSNINSQLRYFLHIDESSKKQGKKVYEIDDIVSNDTITSIEGLINSKKGSIDAYYLRNAVLDSTSDFDLMVKLTLPVYHKYSREIETLKQMRATLVLMRDSEKEDLPF